nr:hypothetical protein [Tanacetum cinerariifolium]
MPIANCRSGLLGCTSVWGDAVDEDGSESTFEIGTQGNGSFPICATSISMFSFPTSWEITGDCMSVVADEIQADASDYKRFDESE